MFVFGRSRLRANPHADPSANPTPSQRHPNAIPHAVEVHKCAYRVHGGTNAPPAREGAGARRGADVTRQAARTPGAMARAPLSRGPRKMVRPENPVLWRALEAL